MSNPFYTDASKEVDDDEFLNHPRSGSSGYMLQNSRNVNSTAYNQFPSGASRDALGLDTEGNRENGMDRVQVILPRNSRSELCPNFLILFILINANRTVSILHRH